ncbi:TPO4 [Candida pseudojiufengensis]|uniref:TPO4 n=1 Tax=Candida pseudojiufengensis TaxID=497109 RepID=UPI0022256BD7|nr:TPO4 [Candida pseudojiufengensis]KAI5961368.1 TPO4 [Candida pseudojiufengensis]
MFSYSRNNSFNSNTGLSRYETAEEEINDELNEEFNNNHKQKNENNSTSQAAIQQPKLESKQNTNTRPDSGTLLNPINNDNTDIELNQQEPPPNHNQTIEPEIINNHDNNNNITSDIENNNNNSTTDPTFNDDSTIDEKNSLKHIKDKSDNEITQEDKPIEISDLDWDGPDDMDNPFNWPVYKKWWINVTVGIMCLTCSLGSSMYTAGVFEMMERFNASQTLVISGLTFYLIGLALGPAFMSGFTVVLGRKPFYVYPWIIGILFIMGCGLAKNIQTLLVLRFFAGFFASPALSVVSGTINDLFSNDPFQQSGAVALFCLMPFLGPVLGPIIGGFAAEYKNWQWSASWVLLMFYGLALISVIFVPETYKTVILVKRAKKRGLNVNMPKPDFELVKKILKTYLLIPFELLFVEPIVLFMSTYIAFIFAVLFGFFEAFPIIFRGVHGMSLGVSGLPFISIAVGFALAVIVYLILDVYYYFPKQKDGSRYKKDENGNIIFYAPEKKLLVGMIGSIFLPISLFWLGWTGKYKSVHWIVPTLAGVPFGFGLLMIFLSVVLYFALAFPPIVVASAMAANNLLRYIVASVFPLFCTQMFENETLTISWAASIFAFISLLMVPIPFVFSHYGARMRAKSKYGYAAYFRQLAEEKAKKEEENEKTNPQQINKPSTTTEDVGKKV